MEQRLTYLGDPGGQGLEGDLFSLYSFLYILTLMLFFIIYAMLINKINKIIKNIYIIETHWKTPIIPIQFQFNKRNLDKYYWDWAYKIYISREDGLRRSKLLSHQEHTASKNAEAILPWSRSELSLQKWRERGAPQWLLM